MDQLRTCFVIAPINDLFDRYYKNIFRRAVVDAGFKPVRADSLARSTDIIGDIWRLTNDAFVLLADLSGMNPNVLYELGLAHALGKPVVLVASRVDDIPFDLRGLRVLIYDKDDEAWGTKLRQDITKALVQSRELSTGPYPFTI